MIRCFLRRVSIVVFVCVACCVPEEERFVVKRMSVVIFERK